MPYPIRRPSPVLLVLTGDAAADQITLTGTKAALQVTAGSQRFAVGRSRFSRVIVRPGAGDDAVLIDETAAVPALTIEGGLGLDAVRVPGTAESEKFTLQAVGDRARISRDTSPSALDLASVEIAGVRAGAGADLVDVGNLAGSGLQRVDADLGVGDRARDQVAAQGSASNEFVSASGSLGAVNVSGLPGGGSIHVEGARAADDRMTLFGGDGRSATRATTSCSTARSCSTTDAMATGRRRGRPVAHIPIERARGRAHPQGCRSTSETLARS
jgi:hypothetical protein